MNEVYLYNIIPFWFGVHKDVVDACIFFGKDINLTTPCKKKKIYGECITKTLQENQTPIVIQQIIGH